MNKLWQFYRLSVDLGVYVAVNVLEFNNTQTQQCNKIRVNSVRTLEDLPILLVFC